MTNAMPSRELLDIATTLIGFDTTSRHSNLGLIEWTRDRLQAQGVHCRLSFDADRRKANLFATVGEPDRSGGLVLSGHSDVVPVDGQAWTRDPFCAELRDGRLYGRGACDMKGFLACMLALVPALVSTSVRRGNAPPVHLAFSYDEEVGCLGVRGMLADLAEAGIRPAACLVVEPTSMRPVIGHKGRRALRCCVTGREAHSSLPALGVNAIEYAARVAAEVQRLARTEAALNARGAGYDVPYSTLQVGTIRGGLMANTVPRECEMTVELRYLPGADELAPLDRLLQFTQDTLVPEMSAVHREAGIEWTVLNDTPGLDLGPQHPLLRQVNALLGDQPPGRVAYSTEAGLFQRAGIPTVLCGPGDIAQAHRPDEYVALSQLAACERFLHAFALEYTELKTVPHRPAAR
jgi:acetylornithine deacetylase